MKDVFKINVPFDDPFIDFSENGWNILSDCSDEQTYLKLDDAWRYIEGETDKPDWAEGMTMEEICAYYNKEFPIMFANALKNYADQILNGTIEYNTEFPV